MQRFSKNSKRRGGRGGGGGEVGRRGRWVTERVCACHFSVRSRLLFLLGYETGDGKNKQMVPTEMKGGPQSVLHNFQPKFPNVTATFAF